MLEDDRDDGKPDALPGYAQSADRSRLVRLFCKAKCCEVRWAVIQEDPPPIETLREAQAFEYSAVCLICEGVARDPYNWLGYYEPGRQKGATALDKERRREINRQNARKSTGPRSAAGKARSSKNSVRHGLLSRRLLLEGESSEELDRLRSGMRKSMEPVGELEEEFVERMVAAVWRKRRAEKVELGLWDWRGSVSSGKATLAEVFFLDSQHDHSLQNLTRYMAAFSGEFHRAYKALQRAQGVRRAKGDDDWVDNEESDAESEDDDGSGGGGSSSAGPPSSSPDAVTARAEAESFGRAPASGGGEVAEEGRRVEGSVGSLWTQADSTSAGRRSWGDLTDGQKAMFAVRNRDEIKAFDHMLTEAIYNPQWMERLGPRDLLRVHESFNLTIWRTIRGANQLLANPQLLEDEVASIIAADPRLRNEPN